LIKWKVATAVLFVMMSTSLTMLSVEASHVAEPSNITLLKLSQIEFYVMLSPSAQVILPNIVGKPVGTIPVGNALATDWSAAGYFGGLAMYAATVYDSDPAVVDPSTGNPTAAAGFGLMIFGGPFVNIPVWFYEQSSSPGGSSSPIYFSYDSNNVWFVQRGVGVIAGTTMPWSEVNSGKTGMILYEFFQDALGRYVLIVYGVSWYDTFGAALFFHGEIWPNLSYYSKSWYIVQRIDNGNGHVDDPGVDTYTVIASGS
jgi:hypothetical protein